MKFDETIKTVLEDCVSGGLYGVFSSNNLQPGQYGNQFPSQNDLAYAPGDARYPFGWGQPTKKKKRKKKVKKSKIQRRQLVEGRQSPDEISKLMRSISPGDIIVCNDNGPTTVVVAVKLVEEDGITDNDFWLGYSDLTRYNHFVYCRDIDWELTHQFKGKSLEEVREAIKYLDV